MKFLLFLMGCFAAPLLAREATLRDGTSPDRRYRVVVVETVERGVVYRVKNAKTGADLLSLRSTYQPEDGANDWGFQKSLGATVTWRKDSRAVAIDEANHNRIGTVLVGRQMANGFRRMPLAGKALLRASKLPWERGRIFFSGWGARTVEVTAVGLVWADPATAPPEKRRRVEASCRFTLALADGDVLSIDPELLKAE